jgi:hypothetical protein
MRPKVLLLLLLLPCLCIVSTTTHALFLPRPPSPRPPKTTGSVSDVPRDQGFTRPKVLLLLPMRNMAYQVVKRLVALAQRETRADSVQVRHQGWCCGQHESCQGRFELCTVCQTGSVV